MRDASQACQVAIVRSLPHLGLHDHHRCVPMLFKDNGSIMISRRRQQHMCFFGQYDVTVLGDRRIILPAKVRQQISDADEGTVWLARVPDVKALVICPDATWAQWRKTIKERFSFLNTPAGVRAYMAASEPTKWDKKGRISLPPPLSSYAAIDSYPSAVIVAMETYFELWSEQIFDKMVTESHGTIPSHMAPQENRRQSCKGENQRHGPPDQSSTSDAGDVTGERD